MGDQRALKFLSPDLSRDKALTSRFLREVRTLRQVHSRNVVDCGDLEAAEDDSLFFSMEFVDGPDLRDFLDGYHPERSAAESNDLHLPLGALQVKLSLSIARGIAEGLGAAHAMGMVHRDIKPENILLARGSDTWVPKIADFGIVATKENSSVYTRTGGTLLTMAYAAPEQWRGTAAAELDGRTDLYALGGVLFEMLTGQTVFQAENYEGWAERHRNYVPSAPSTLRPELASWRGLESLVLQMLAKNRQQRPADVANVIDQLDAVRFVELPARRVTVIEGEEPDAHGEESRGHRKSHSAGLQSLFSAVEPDRGIAKKDDGSPIGLFGSSRPPTSEGGSDEEEASSQEPKNLWSGIMEAPRWIQGALAAVLVLMLFAAFELVKLSTTAPSSPQPVQSQAEQSGNALQPQTTAEKPQPSKPENQQPAQNRPGQAVSNLPAQPIAQDHPPAAASTDFAAMEKQAEELESQKRFDEADALFRQACSGGIGAACFHARLYPEACRLNDANGCNELGSEAARGRTGPRDSHQAAEYYSKACNLGDADGCFNLANLYDSVTSGMMDLGRAASGYSTLCNGGYVAACAQLADMYNNGDGVARDTAKARQLKDRVRELLTAQCARGDKSSCAKLGKS